MEYRIKVIEKHSDIVDVEANSLEEAESMAIRDAECNFECLYDIVLIESEEHEDSI